jgi:hypothetical protein
MNGLEQKITVRQGSLYEPVHGQIFDHVIANPPLLPLPSSLEYPFVGHGGPDGLRITRQILEGLNEYLAPGGVAQIIGTCLSDGILPEIVSGLSQIATAHLLDITLTITAHCELKPGSPQFALLASTAAMAGQPVEKVSELLDAHLANHQATHLSFFYLFVRCGRGDFQLMDLASEKPLLSWYAWP